MSPAKTYNTTPSVDQNLIHPMDGTNAHGPVYTWVIWLACSAYCTCANLENITASCSYSQHLRPTSPTLLNKVMWIYVMNKMKYTHFHLPYTNKNTFVTTQSRLFLTLTVHLHQCCSTFHLCFPVCLIGGRNTTSAIFVTEFSQGFLF